MPRPPFQTPSLRAGRKGWGNSIAEVLGVSRREVVTKEIAKKKKKREVVTYPEIHSPNCHTVKSQTCALEEEKRSPAHLVCSCVYVGTVYTAVYVHVGMHVYLHF